MIEYFRSVRPSSGSLEKVRTCTKFKCGRNHASVYSRPSFRCVKLRWDTAVEGSIKEWGGGVMVKCVRSSEEEAGDYGCW